MTGLFSGFLNSDMTEEKVDGAAPPRICLDLPDIVFCAVFTFLLLLGETLTMGFGGGFG